MVVFGWLKKQSRQVLLFTNDKDMADIFQKTVAVNVK